MTVKIESIRLLQSNDPNGRYGKLELRINDQELSLIEKVIKIDLSAGQVGQLILGERVELK